jgi:uncharacterized membrane protein
VSSSATPTYWCLGYVVASFVALIVGIRQTLHLAGRIDYLMLFEQDLRDADNRVIKYRPAPADA